MAAQQSMRLTVRAAAHEEMVCMLGVVATDLGGGLEELALDGRTVGFVQRAGRIFVALSGIRADRAVECGQFLLWEQAAAQLLSGDGGATHWLVA